MTPTPDPLRAALEQIASLSAVIPGQGFYRQASMDDIADIARTALAAQPAPPLDVERLQAHLTHAHSLCGQCQRFAAALSEPKS